MAETITKVTSLQQFREIVGYPLAVSQDSLENSLWISISLANPLLDLKGQGFHL